ncbi:cytosine permease [Clostridiales bacterium]|nr:cytosine permease [Clostridiales bacterium]
MQAGITICVPSLMLGSILISGLGFSEAIWAGALGTAIGTAVMTVTGMIGHDLGVPSVVILRSSFGKAGSRFLFSLVLGITLLSWFGIQAQVCGAAFAHMFESITGIALPELLSTIIWGVIMCVTAVYGVNALKWLNYIAVPALLIISFYGAYVVVAENGMDAVLHYAPEDSMKFIDGVIMAYGYLTFAGVVAADFTRFQRSRKDTVLSTTIGIFPLGVILLILGSIMATLAGTYDIALIMVQIGLPIIGAVALILATWTTNTTNAYSAGIDMVALLDAKGDKRAAVTLVCGVIGTVLGAIGLMDYVSNILSWSSYLFTPIIGVMITDYFVLRKGRAENWDQPEGFGVAAVVACAAGSIVCFLTTGFSPLYGFLVAAVLYFGLKKAFPALYVFAKKQ